MHGQVTHASSLHSFECLSLVSSYVGGCVFFSCPPVPGVFRVWPQLCPLLQLTRSRSPMRSGSVQDEKIEEPKENPDAQVGLNAPEGLPEAETEKKELKDANEGLRDELATPAEETAGKQLLEAVVSASRSLTICAKELEKNCSLLSDVKDSAVALESLTPGVNDYASTTKAANSAQTQNHKQIQWDWLSTERTHPNA